MQLKSPTKSIGFSITTKMDQQPPLQEEPPFDPIKPSVKMSYEGFEQEYDNKNSFKMLKYIEDNDIAPVDGAISEVRNIESSTDTTEIKDCILKILQNKTYHSLVKFHILAVVFDQYCKVIVAQGGYNQWQFEEDKAIIDAINETCNMTKMTNMILQLGQVY